MLRLAARIRYPLSSNARAHTAVDKNLSNWPKGLATPIYLHLGSRPRNEGSHRTPGGLERSENTSLHWHSCIEVA
jgi:hypothetical protein